MAAQQNIVQRKINHRAKNLRCVSLVGPFGRFMEIELKKSSFRKISVCHNFVEFPNYKANNRQRQRKDPRMIYREIVHTCSNSYVADAALISIGGEIARAVADDATRHDMSRGAYAAMLVRDFAVRADDRERDRVLEAAQGSEQPILSGLRYILEQRAAPDQAWMRAARM